MAGEEFLKFNNGQKFSFSNFKEIKEEDLKDADAETKRLFNIFAGDDKILQADEAQSLWNKLKNAANSNNDNILDEDELSVFLNSQSIYSLEETEKPELLTAVKEFFTTIFSSDESNDEIDFDSIAENSDTEYLQQFLSDMLKKAEKEERSIQQKVVEKRVNQVRSDIYNSELEEITLSQEFKTIKDLAKNLLKFSDKTKLTREEQAMLDNKIIELNLLNYGRTLKSGEKFVVKGSPLNADLIKQMSGLGFPPNSENMLLFQYLKDLDQKNQAEIFAIIKNQKLVLYK